MARNRDVQQEILVRGPVQLRRLLDDRQQLEELVRELVRDLVLAGLSYADVGRMLGVTRQSARERFGPAVDSWRAEWGDLMPWEVGATPSVALMDAPDQEDDDPWAAQTRVQQQALDAGKPL